MKLGHNWLAAIVLTGVLPVTAQEKADLVLQHGKVVTVDATFRSALAVKDAKILAVGGDELADRYAATTKVAARKKLCSQH